MNFHGTGTEFSGDRLSMRAVLHVDMDAFYAAVEALDHPPLRGKPLIVGGLGGRGVVAAASYEVRRFGVHSAMPVSQALRRCPEAICIEPRFERYKAVSRAVFGIFHEFTPLVESLSLDEAFLDVTHSRNALGSAESIARSIKQKILERTGLTASVGIASNKLVAKIASELRKPDGLVSVPQERVVALLDPLPVRTLFGIGAKTASQLENLGIHTLRELRLPPDVALQPVFGRHAAHIKARAAGIDDRPVIADWDEKRISTEETFATDILERRHLHAALAQIADRTAARLRTQGWLAATLIVKIRRRDFRTYTRQCPIRPATQASRLLAQTAARLLDEWLEEQPGAAVRLLGVGAGDLTQAAQLDLFDIPEAQRNRQLDAAIDNIRARFGSAALARGSALPNRSDPGVDGGMPRRGSR
ncbi:DNA polymerase IV [Steroidobacter denitrificans]|uniref:DNA polymerase IV n=1 Tax=Steroidobacter denitrificans TaxID=465721 RepID=A0A127FEB4_STEDE|nr:DNA polymerase IV [Steroidobacter denitrificans]AMN48205.1 DNA polymerase IV [Steroidobacter denitrificans]